MTLRVEDVQPSLFPLPPAFPAYRRELNRSRRQARAMERP